jgi:hypothetical protein
MTDQVTVFIKDGRTALLFADAADFRMLLHGRPGLKNGGKLIDALEFRWSPTQERYVPALNVQLRYIDKHGISRVQQGQPELDAVA